MSFPKQSEIELPLLKLLHQLGGKAEPKELYPKLAEMFPQLTEEDLAARMPSSPSIFRWHNIVQWSRQKLVEKGEIDPTTRGVWKLMSRGKARATGAAANTAEELLLANQATLKDLVYENEAEVKRRIISELHSLGATEFEQFCVSLLGPLGYQQLQVRIAVPTAGLTAMDYFVRASSQSALRFKRSAGATIRSAGRRSINSAVQFRATTTTASSLPQVASHQMLKPPRSRKAPSPYCCSTEKRSLKA
jgi:restriction system protein